MAGTQSEQPRLPPARPEGTQAFMDPTGFCVTALAQLVHGFRRKNRTDACLGPAFTGCIAGWTLNPERMVSFWPLAEALTPVVTPVPLIGRRIEGVPSRPLVQAKPGGARHTIHGQRCRYVFRSRHRELSPTR